MQFRGSGAASESEAVLCVHCLLLRSQNTTPTSSEHLMKTPLTFQHLLDEDGSLRDILVHSELLVVRSLKLDHLDLVCWLLRS